MKRRITVQRLCALVFVAGLLASQGVFAGERSYRKAPDLGRLDPASYVPGELLVRFRAHAQGRVRTAAERREVLNVIAGARIRSSYKIVPGLSHIRLPAGVTVKEAIATLARSNDILYVEPNYKVELFATEPNDVDFGELWGLHNTGQTVNGMWPIRPSAVSFGIAGAAVAAAVAAGAVVGAGAAVGCAQAARVNVPETRLACFRKSRRVSFMVNDLLLGERVCYD